MLGTTHPLIQRPILEDLYITVARSTFVNLDISLVQICNLQVNSEETSEC
jgi:hypothetical protein